MRHSASVLFTSG